VRTVEWIVLSYLAYVAVVAWVRPIGAGRRARVTAGAVIDSAFIVWLAGRASPVALVLRDWLPAAHILIGYRLSGPLFTRPMPRAEAWLAATDRWCFDRLGFRWFAERGPRAFLELFEAAYVSAYVMVPLGFALVSWRAPGTDADRYWAPVVAAELFCYGMLPWIRTRTPGSLGHDVAIDARAVTVRRLNRIIQRHGSVLVNTVPSGHAAGALATALLAGAAAPDLLAPLLFLALLIGLASVIGRYHYAVDSVLGFLVGAAAALQSRS